MNDKELETEKTGSSPRYRIGELSVSEEGPLVSKKTDTPYGSLYAEVSNFEHISKWHRENYDEAQKKEGFGVSDTVVVIGEDEGGKPKQVKFQEAFDSGYSIVTPILADIPRDYLRKNLSIKVRNDDAKRTYTVALWAADDEGKKRYAWTELLFSDGEQLRKEGWGTIFGLAVKNLDELQKVSLEIGGGDLTK